MIFYNILQILTSEDSQLKQDYANESSANDNEEGAATQAHDKRCIKK